MDLIALSKTLNQYLFWNQHLSGWGQFFGGAIAVVAAFSIAAADRRERHRDAERKQRMLEASIVAAHAFASGAATTWLTTICSPNERAKVIVESNIEFSDIEDALAMIDRIPLQDIHSIDVAAFVLGFRTKCVYAAKQLKFAFSVIKGGQELSEEDVEAINSTIEAFKNQGEKLGFLIRDARLARRSSTWLPL